ncbi:MAG: alpha-amylase family protein [Bryobacteraceae bacterium]|nr:alpha-amylase family protein [Bryobacteraceae bacterium]
MKTTRRDFVVLSAAAATSAAGLAQNQLPWHQRLRRIGQVNFNERDPQEADVEAWANLWAEAKVDAVLVNVTGMIAFYPSKVPYHKHSRFLNGRDFFGDCCRAAKKRGIHVVGRMSPDLQWEDALQAHPEWFRRDEQGRPMPHSSRAPGLYQTCMFTPYYSEQTPAVMREVNQLYDVDGLYANGWPNFNVPACYCQYCREVGKPGTMEYHKRYMDRAVELWQLYDRIAKEKRQENLFFGNLGGGIRSGLDLKRLGDVAALFTADNQGRVGASPVWGAAQQGRVAYCVMKGRTVANVTASWSTGSPMWRNATKSIAEAETWMAQSTATGMVVWYHWLGAQRGLGEDRRWQEPGNKYHNWHARHDRHFANKATVANLGIVLGQRTQTFYRPPGEGDAGEYIQGAYYSVLETRRLFDFVHEDDLTPGVLRKYDALILPNVAFLSDAQCRQIEAYVNNGGSLIATFETSLYDELGKARADYGLANLFGMHRKSERQGSQGFENSFYGRLEKPHELTRGFTDTNWIAGAEWRAPIRADGELIMSVVPPYPAYPTEITVSPTPQTDEPAMIARERGGSRLVYFSGDVDRTYWRTGHPDPGRVLANAISWVLRGRQPATVEGEGLVEIVAWETEPGFTVHVLNYNNPNLHRGYLRQHYPIGAQKVSFRLPKGMKVRTVSLLRSETAAPFTQKADVVEFVIPRVVDYEVAAIEKA